MDQTAYDEMKMLEDGHWWFRARRALCHALLKYNAPPKGAQILEAGCGSGGNLSLLAEFGAVWAFEPYEAALEIARKRNIGTITRGELPDGIPFNERFDCIAMFDVLEHLQDDQKCLDAVLKQLKPGGIFLASVPACPALWSVHDELHHHYRRYSRQSLTALLEGSGLHIFHMHYGYIFTFPLLLVARMLDKLLQRKHPSGLGMPHPWVNQMLFSITASERFLPAFLRRGIGSSLLVIAKKR